MHRSDFGDQCQGAGSLTIGTHQPASHPLNGLVCGNFKGSVVNSASVCRPVNTRRKTSTSSPVGAVIVFTRSAATLSSRSSSSVQPSQLIMRISSLPNRPTKSKRRWVSENSEGSQSRTLFVFGPECTDRPVQECRKQTKRHRTDELTVARIIGCVIQWASRMELYGLAGVDCDELSLFITIDATDNCVGSWFQSIHHPSSAASANSRGLLRRVSSGSTSYDKCHIRLRW